MIGAKSGLILTTIMGHDNHSQPPSEEQGEEEKAVMATEARGNRDLEEGRAGLSITSRSGGKQSRLFRQAEFPAAGDNYFDSYLSFRHMHLRHRLT